MKKTFKDYLYVLCGTGFSRFAAFLNTVIVARWLGPEEFGRFSIFYIVMILTWQIPQAFDNTYIRYAKTSVSSDEKNDYLKTSVFVKIAYAVLLLAVAYPLGYFLAYYAFDKPNTIYLIVAGILCGIFLSFLMSVASVFQEKERFGMFAILPSLQSGSILVILLFLMIAGYMDRINTTRFVLIYTSTGLLLGSVSVIALLRKTGKLFPLQPDILKRYFSFAKWILGVTVAYYLFQRVDIMVLTRYSLFKDVGIYSVAVQPIMLISLLIGSISGVFLPKAMNAVRSRSSLSVYITEAVYSIAIPVAGIIILMIIAPYFIMSFYGEQYLAATSILRILLIGWLATSFYLPFSFLFYALNDARSRFVLELLKVATAFVLLLYLVPFKGTYGAALSISIALILNTLLSFLVLWIKLRNKLDLRKDKNVINTNT